MDRWKHKLNAKKRVNELEDGFGEIIKHAKQRDEEVEILKERLKMQKPEW